MKDVLKWRSDGDESRFAKKTSALTEVGDEKADSVLPEFGAFVAGNKFAGLGAEHSFAR